MRTCGSSRATAPPGARTGPRSNRRRSSIPKDPTPDSIRITRRRMTCSPPTLAPFDKDGKQAVRAYVFRSANGKVFVNHLERFKPDAKQAIERASKPDPKQTTAGPPKHLSAMQSAYTGGREVKRPGDEKWI